ncbi:MAG: hypothetical protein P4L84_22315 [Isosphaeraceae bacterium]|nr:hypothetical protein [Isosphaeraceae bacterium]
MSARSSARDAIFAPGAIALPRTTIAPATSDHLRAPGRATAGVRAALGGFLLDILTRIAHNLRRNVI